MLTIIISLIAIVLSILIMVLQSQINAHSNESAYQDQIGLIGYVANNIQTAPIKKYLKPHTPLAFTSETLDVMTQKKQ